MITEVQFNKRKRSEQKTRRGAPSLRPEGPNRERAKRARVPDVEASEVTDNCLTTHDF